jgi:hypothetical protein
MSNKISLELDVDQTNRIIESLLFASSVSVGADWKKEECEGMIEIARVLKNTLGDQMKLDNINFFKEDYYEDSCSENILNEFGNHFDIVSLDL